MNDASFLGVKELLQFIFLVDEGIELILKAGNNALHFACHCLAHLPHLFMQGHHLGMFIHKLLAQFSGLNLQIGIAHAQATDRGVIDEGRIFGTLRQIRAHQEFPQLIEFRAQGQTFPAFIQIR